MERKKNKLTHTYKAELSFSFGVVCALKAVYDCFAISHSTFGEFLADNICIIIFGIVAIVQAKKENPPATKWKKLGIAEVVAGFVLPVVLILTIGVIPEMARRRNAAAGATATPKITEKADSKTTVESESVETAQPDATADSTDEDLAGKTYEDIYNEYVSKIDQAEADAVSEYQSKAANLDDSDKSSLTSSLTEKIENVAYEGSNKIFDLSMQKDDDSTDYSTWQDKLTDYASQKEDEINSLANGE